MRRLRYRTPVWNREQREQKVSAQLLLLPFLREKRIKETLKKRRGIESSIHREKGMSATGLHPLLDNRTVGILKPVFVARCARWTSHSFFVNRLLVVSKDGVLFLLNGKQDVTHSVILRAPDDNQILAVEYEWVASGSGSDSQQQQRAASFASPPRKQPHGEQASPASLVVAIAAVKKTMFSGGDGGAAAAGFSVAKRVGAEPDVGVILRFASTGAVPASALMHDFISVLCGFKRRFCEQLASVRRALRSEARGDGGSGGSALKLSGGNSSSSNSNNDGGGGGDASPSHRDGLPRDDDYRLTELRQGELLQWAMLARGSSGSGGPTRYLDAAAIKEGPVVRLLKPRDDAAAATTAQPSDPSSSPPPYSAVNLFDVTLAAARSADGSPVRLDRPPGLRHLPADRVIPKEVLLQRPPIAGDALDAIRQKLVDIYTTHHPAKVKDVDDLLEKYTGLEDLLLIKVACTYTDVYTPGGTFDREATSRADTARQQHNARQVMAQRLPGKLRDLPDCQAECEAMQREIRQLEQRCDGLQAALTTQTTAAGLVYEQTRASRRNLGALVSEVCLQRQRQRWHATEGVLAAELAAIQHELMAFAKLL